MFGAGQSPYSSRRAASSVSANSRPVRVRNQRGVRTAMKSSRSSRVMSSSRSSVRGKPARLIRQTLSASLTIASSGVRASGSESWVRIVRADLVDQFSRVSGLFEYLARQPGAGDLVLPVQIGVAAVRAVGVPLFSSSGISLQPRSCRRMAGTATRALPPSALSMATTYWQEEYGRGCRWLVCRAAAARARTDSQTSSRGRAAVCRGCPASAGRLCRSLRQRPTSSHRKRSRTQSRAVVDGVQQQMDQILVLRPLIRSLGDLGLSGLHDAQAVG